MPPGQAQFRLAKRGPRWFNRRMQKDEIADILKEIGVFLELKGENPFKTRAYQNGARTLEGLTEPLEVLIEEERLGKVKGIGSALADKITELANTGKLAYYDDLKACGVSAIFGPGTNIPEAAASVLALVDSALGGN